VRLANLVPPVASPHRDEGELGQDDLSPQFLGAFLQGQVPTHTGKVPLLALTDMLNLTCTKQSLHPSFPQACFFISVKATWSSWYLCLEFYRQDSAFLSCFATYSSRSSTGSICQIYPEFDHFLPFNCYQLIKVIQANVISGLNTSWL
jgi:hypothetical protein